MPIHYNIGALSGDSEFIIPSVSEDVVLSTVGAETDSTIDLPANSFIFAVTALITVAIVGVDSTALFISSVDGNFFGQLTTFTIDSVTPGMDHHETPQPVNFEAQKVRLTLSGGEDNTPDAGAVRLTVHYMQITLPTS
jgi:hypothetical protein